MRRAASGRSWSRPLPVLCLAALLAGVWVPGRAQGAGPAAIRLPILVMHHVKWDQPGDDATELGLTIHPTQFRQELAYLSSHHYHPVSAAQVVRVLTRGGPLPSRPVVLSFDDGYADMYRTVYPTLRARDMTATFFVCPGLLGKPRYMTWEQVRVMARHGMDIEAHTLTHPDLTAVPAAEARAEVAGSRVALRTRLHVAATVFAYPYGAFNSAILQDVQRAGFAAAFTTQQGWQLSRSLRYLLPRVYIDRDDSLAQFAARLTGNLRVVEQDPT